MLQKVGYAGYAGYAGLVGVRADLFICEYKCFVINQLTIFVQMQKNLGDPK